MTAFDYHYHQWRKGIIMEYLQQTSDGRFDPAGFVIWMQGQPWMCEPPARPASAPDASEPVIRILPEGRASSSRNHNILALKVDEPESSCSGCIRLDQSDTFDEAEVTTAVPPMRR